MRSRLCLSSACSGWDWYLPQVAPAIVRTTAAAAVKAAAAEAATADAPLVAEVPVRDPAAAPAAATATPPARGVAVERLILAHAGSPPAI